MSTLTYISLKTLEFYNFYYKLLFEKKFIIKSIQFILIYKYYKHLKKVNSGIISVLQKINYSVIFYIFIEQ